MDEKTLQILEYFKILERLAGYTAFDISAERARALRPVVEIEEARRLQAETAEALRFLVTHPDLSIGGAHDIRSSVDLARHGGVLAASELLDVKFTLVAARSLARTFERFETEFLHLFLISTRMRPPAGLVDAISRAIADRGDILDSASEKLADIRHDLRVAHERLLTRLQRMVSDPRNAPYLQETLFTQRDGRYVLPLRAEFKGRIKSIVHDQSASGATLFVEPLAVVELNNQFRELQLAERDEERRILAELSRWVGVHAQDILQTVEAVADLDLVLARARYAEDLGALEPILHLIPPPARQLKPKDMQTEGVKISRHPGSLMRLYQARHPLLDQETVVPIDVELDAQTYALIITGPNTGGKTVTLKTVGLLVLMAQSGLHIPVHSGSELSVFHEVYADIGDEQSIEQSLSTFSGHITNIIHILERADRRSLVILDELGAGTDPQEGAALARSILSHLLERSITTFVTTHHPELKAFAHATVGVVNASVEFDLETLRPTYHLVIGLPGRSNALAIAQRLGLPEEIVNGARADLNPEDVRAEDLLNEIHRQRDLSRQARAAADRANVEAQHIRNELMLRLEKIEEERRTILETARLEAGTQIRELQDELRELRRSLARARQPVEILQPIETQVQILEEKVEKPVDHTVPELEWDNRRAIRLGDKVRLRSINMQGIVTALSEDEADVQVGKLRVRARLSDLETRAEAAAAAASATVLTRSEGRPASEARSNSSASRSLSSSSSFDLPVSPGMELDLRGQRADDALEALDRYLDAAYLAGMPFVRIIHGRGTGRLREVVRKTLNSHPQVKSFESGGDKEGGDGVTVVKLAL